MFGHHTSKIVLKFFDTLTRHKSQGYGRKELQGCPLWEGAMNCPVPVPDSSEMAENNLLCTKT